MAFVVIAVKFLLRKTRQLVVKLVTATGRRGKEFLEKMKLKRASIMSFGGDVGGDVLGYIGDQVDKYTRKETEDLSRQVKEVVKQFAKTQTQEETMKILLEMEEKKMFETQSEI